MSMGDCVCINLLTYEEKLEWLDRILASRFSIHKNTEKILIVSNIDEAKCGLNNLGFLIKKGINVTCLCALKELHYDFNLKLSSYFLSTLKPIESSIANCQAFKLSGIDHKNICKNSELPSLIEICFNKLYSEGCQDSHVKKFMKQGTLPKGLYVRKPKTFVHLPYFEIHSLLNLFVPFPLPYTLACSKPQEHLNVTIEVDL
jgi:hypothetical protein